MGLVTRNHTYKPIAQSHGCDGAKVPHEHNGIHHEQNRALPENRSSPGLDYLQIVARATNDAVRDWDIIAGTLSWPQGLESLLGYPTSGQELNLSFWQQHVHPSDRARIATSLREALANQVDHWSGEYRFQRADGDYLQLLERAVIDRDAAGKPTRLVGSLMDVTARKQLQDQLSRSQKMEAFGQLAAGVAHDFNNFLTTILGYSDLVLSESGAKGAIASHVAEIRGAAGRASVLASQLLAFSRRQALEPHVVEVNNLVQNLERSLLRLLGDNITVVCHLHRDKAGAHIKVDPGQLTQIILNLTVNARDAMHAGGQLTLETASVVLKQDDPAPCGLDVLPFGDYVVISIVDTGIGMSEDVKNHLFEPFFTTKNEGGGSGLGLATSYGIVRQSGGSIRIESELNQGTRVEIYLPKVAAPPAPSYKKPADRKLPVGTESILVLEDDISVRHMSVRILRSLGYEVTEAANGDDAQRLFSQDATRKIHLLLTDMVMPNMSGRFFADWLQKASPETRVVFVSGYLEESLHPGDRLENGMFFLPKPFDPEQLAKTVRQVLDS
jgi:two-component system, cell cycle sensor histidine kinase and response regulator CckA